MNNTRIVKTIDIDDLIYDHPGFVRHLIRRGLPCLVCGEPTWGTLEHLARDKGFTDEAIDNLVDELNDIIEEGRS
ncbi:MAG: DUF1858 domain-containing protein [Ignavibacteria bacterium]|nr:DUF1858 domain-containing protein [Ignavibacteria bacterium]